MAYFLPKIGGLLDDAAKYLERVFDFDEGKRKGLESKYPQSGDPMGLSAAMRGKRDF